MSKCRFRCNSAAERLLTQIDPVTKKQIEVWVYDAELSISPNAEENKQFFATQQFGSLKFVACTMEFKARQEYLIDISPIEATPPKFDPGVTVADAAP